ncbi:MAG TPA: L,D-transpeptidase family protein [Myxococcota bacterium]|nr:L,D-transpeptidase family protein [Myxococcota bacterium]
MTGPRSRSARRAALLLLAALAACATPPPPQPHYLLESPPPSPDLVGKLSFRETKQQDTLIDLAPELGVGYVELLAANPGVDPWLPGETRLAVPGARLLPSGKREGIVVNLGDLHLYWFAKDAAPRAYPIGIAKDGYATPTGVTSVKAKREKPPWVPSESAHRDDPKLPAVIPPGPDNPLGDYALYLGWSSYLIHGTNDARGVGRHSSRGCIRLYPADIAELFGQVPIGTPVRVVFEPVKLGWVGGELFLEVNPDSADSLELDETGKVAAPRPLDPRTLHAQVLKAAGKEAARIDWKVVERAAERRIGVPSQITRPAVAAGLTPDAR